MNTNFDEAQRRYHEARAESKALIAAADNRKDTPGQFTAEEQEKFDGLVAEMEAIGERYPMARAKTKPELRGQTNGQPNGQRDGGNAAGRVGATYADLFPNAVSDTGGFDSFGEFASTLHQGMADNRLIPSAQAGHSSGVGSDGGFMVPTAMLGRLLDQSLENEIVRPRARTIPLVSGTAKAPGFDVEDNSENIGGFSGQWLSEGQSMTWQKGLIRSITLHARKLGILTSASNELVADSPFFDSELLSILSEATAFLLDEAFLTGDGVGRPRGVIHDEALITVAKESGQPAETITYNNLKAMLNRLHPAMRDPVWVASSSTREQLLSLVQHVRNDGDTDNVGGTWVPAMREDGNGWRILGLPVMFTEKLPSLGSEGDIVLADFSQYFVGLGQNATLRTSTDALFDSDEVAFRITARVDGQGRWSKPLTPRNGGTLSWCVALADRA